MWAARRNPVPAVISTLLAAGARIGDRDHAGMTALMWAARDTENPDILSTLIAAGADPRTVNDRGVSALAYARGNPNLRGTDAVKLLSEVRR